MSGQCPFRIAVGGKQTITWHKDRLVGFGIILDGLTGYENKFRNFIGIDRKSNRIYRPSLFSCCSCPSIKDDKLCGEKTHVQGISFSCIIFPDEETFTFHLIPAKESLWFHWSFLLAQSKLSVKYRVSAVSVWEHDVIYKENPRNWAKDQTLLRHKLPDTRELITWFAIFFFRLQIPSLGETELYVTYDRQVMMMMACPCPSFGYVISLLGPSSSSLVTVVHSNL